ncbi:ABC transporter substrate-binding protein [Alkaliphilus pronyensis]|nr:cobalamin-binding protein [Alkaliphilus pronyensis]
MKKSLIMFFIIMLLTVGLLAGCGGEEGTIDKPEELDSQEETQVEEPKYPLVITDGLGNQVTINSKPEKFISIAPSQTEILYALGLGDKLVAVSDYCDYPAEAQDMEKVGSSWTTNSERIIELNPDIVFVYGEGQPEAIQQLEAAGITIVKYMPETIEEILETIAVIGEIADEEERAQKLIEEMENKRDEIIAKVKDKPKKKVFYQVWDEPLMTAGPGSFIDELIVLAGGENIASDAEGAYPQFSVEVLVERNPEIYIAPAHTSEKSLLTEEEELQLKNNIKARPGYSNIAAIKNDKIELLEPNVVSRPGARIIEALELIAKAIHPDAF